MRVRFVVALFFYLFVAVVSVFVSVCRGLHDNFQCHIRLSFIEKNCRNEQKPLRTCFSIIRTGSHQRPAESVLQTYARIFRFRFLFRCLCSSTLASNFYVRRIGCNFWPRLQLNFYSNLYIFECVVALIFHVHALECGFVDTVLCVASRRCSWRWELPPLTENMAKVISQYLLDARALTPWHASDHRIHGIIRAPRRA